MRQVDPQKTPRAQAFALWMQAPMPMVTLFQTMDVTRLVKQCKKRNISFHPVFCWCIGKAAARMKEFSLLPVGNCLMQFDRLAINTIVKTSTGAIASCDIPYHKDLPTFYRRYRRLTRQVASTGAPYEAGKDYMVIGTSALPQFPIEGAVNLYAGCFNNPFLIWGKYETHLFQTTLKLSFQFHHTQMDGEHGAEFFSYLQQELHRISLS